MSLKQQQSHPKYPARGTEEKPVYFTHPVVIQNIRSGDKPNGWAEPFWDNMTEKEKMNVILRVPMKAPIETRDLFDTNLGRDSLYTGPLNPSGSTGMVGRGLLGCYGPNYAADPIVTRFNNGVLEMAAIQRSDTGDWAIPGGMVEKGATVSATLKNEFHEEALGNTLGTGDAEYIPVADGGVHDCSGVKSKEDPVYLAKIAALREEVDHLFSSGTTVYKGWVDDPRNTDWAWMETVAVHFHIADDSPIHNIELRPATDATGAKWYKLENPEDIRRLYASHGEFVLNAVRMRAEPGTLWSKVYLGLVV